MIGPLATVLDIAGLTADAAPATGDLLPRYDISAAGNRQTTLGNHGSLWSVGTFEARMQLDSTTQVSLQRYKGQYVWINGEYIDPGSGGLALVTTDNLLSSTGTDSGGAMGTNTLYYVYVSNSSASFAPGDLRASATAPSLLNGVKYLATSANGANWRFVGWVRTNGSTQFLDNVTDRRVVNYYNRERKDILICPAYSDGASATSYTTTSTTLVQANAGTGCTASFISNGEDAVDYGVFGAIAVSTAGRGYIGVGEDSTTTASVLGMMDEPAGGLVFTAGAGKSSTFAEGYHTLDMLIATQAGTATYYADFGRLGGSADIRTTYLKATVMC